MRFQYFYYFFICVLFLASCDKDDNDNIMDNSDGYDRSTMLYNWSDNIIIPAYNNLYADLLELHGVIEEFAINPTVNLLNSSSEKWLTAYKSWQYVEMFDIGLAEVINYKGKMNIYPVDIDLIMSNISNGNYDLNNNNNFDSRGFPALDYMLHGLGDDNNAILDIYTSNSGYVQYLQDIIGSMLYNTNLIIEDWTSFRSDFVSSTSNTATSSINKLINDFIYYFEKGLRANKIGIPAGVFSADPLPDRVEGYYKRNVSKDLTIEALIAVENFFKGKYFNSEIYGLSLESYLDYIQVSSNNNLSSLIISQISDAVEQVNQLDNDYVFQINSNNTQMLYAYDAIQLLVVSFKVDMLQALSVSVDYIDADGD